MCRFLTKLWQWIKSWFRQNPSPSPPPSPQPKLSDLEYENLLLELLSQVAREDSWGKLQGFLIAKQVEPDELARWLKGFSKRWLLQPESHGELANRLLLLSRLARGELRQVAKELAEGLSVGETSEEEEEASLITTNQHSVDRAYQKIIPHLETEDPSPIIAQLQASLDDSQSLLIKTFADCDAPKLMERIKQAAPIEIYQLIQQPLSRQLIDFVQQPLSKAVVAKLQQDSILHPYHFNPRLNLRGYPGEIASLKAGLDKAIKPDTHPLDWGMLHYYLGNAHYHEGCRNAHPFDYWRKAVASYNRALSTLTEADYPEEHLQVLQGLIKIQLGIGATETAAALQLKGLEILKNLYNRAPSFAAKKKLELKFSGFRQLRVDVLLNQGQLIPALTSAELSKNLCLSNLLNNWQEKIVSPSYEQIQQLLTPARAIVYWHVSPQALNTFVLKANTDKPIIIERRVGNAHTTTNPNPPESNPHLTQPNQQDTGQIPPSLHRLQQYQTWLKEWNQQYQDYRGKNNKNKPKTQVNRRNHPWRTAMLSRLEELKSILDIDTIQSHLSGITQLILIPHQDLHRLPLHLLFETSLAASEPDKIEERDLTISYFPSLQMALTIQQRQPNHSPLSLLSVENPDNNLDYAEIESTVINSLFSQLTHIERETATNSVVKTALQQPHHIFHFTGHGAYNQRQAENSFLTLAKNDHTAAEKITAAEKKLQQQKLVSLT